MPLVNAPPFRLFDALTPPNFVIPAQTGIQQQPL